MSRVIIHIDLEGNVTTMHGDGVEVLWVDERCPSDRVYRSRGADTEAELDAVLADSPVGHADDGKLNAARNHYLASLAHGRSHLTVVDDD